MKNVLLRKLLEDDVQNLLDALTTRQHLHPHEPLARSLAATVDCLGVCPDAIAQAVRWLGVDPAASIGRLRRTELTQLARSIHRFWRHEPRPHQQPATQS